MARSAAYVSPPGWYTLLASAGARYQVDDASSFRADCVCGGRLARRVGERRRCGGTMGVSSEKNKT